MAVQKKSLVSALNTAKKANIAGAKPEAGDAAAETVVSTKAISAKGVSSAKSMLSQKRLSAKKAASMRRTSMKAGR